MQWDTFWATVAGTFVGALVGIFGVLWAFRLESKERYRTRLDEAVARVMVDLAQFNEDFGAYMRDVQSDERARPPSDLKAVASMEVAAMVAKGEDFEILNQLAHNTYNAVRTGHPAVIAAAHGIIIGNLGRWRSGHRSKKEILDSFDTAAQVATRLLRDPPEDAPAE
jgi:hypothetical protein